MLTYYASSEKVTADHLGSQRHHPDLSKRLAFDGCLIVDSTLMRCVNGANKGDMATLPAYLLDYYTVAIRDPQTRALMANYSLCGGHGPTYGNGKGRRMARP